MRDGLATWEGGESGPLLVLLHGMGATAGVWSHMLEAPRWGGRWLAADLPGHGASAARDSYAIADHAAVLAGAISDAAAGSPVVLLGHSLGGVIALALASGHYDLRPERVLALGVKVDWRDEELARMDELAERPARLFATKPEALAFYRRQSGLSDAEDDSPLLARGVIAAEGGWRLAMDNGAFRAGRFDFGELVAKACCPVSLGCGEHDQMISVDRLRDFDSEARMIEGASHNAMVDHPDAVWDWVISR